MSQIDPKKRYELPPNRSYLIPGGPYPGEIKEEVRVLAEFKRGSEDDRGVGNQR